MEFIRLFLRKCVDSANADGIISKRIVKRMYNSIGDNVFNLSLEDALFVSVVGIMGQCDNSIHVSDVYGMWNACRVIYCNKFGGVYMDQLRDAYMENPREFAKCIRNREDYIDVVEKNNEIKLSICLFEIGKIVFSLLNCISIHSNENPETVGLRRIEYGLYDE